MIHQMCTNVSAVMRFDNMLPCISGPKPMKSKSSDRGGKVNHSPHHAAPHHLLKSGGMFDSGTATRLGKKVT